MSNATLMPFVLPRQFSLDGKVLSGGKIWTYQSGTNTPKTTYATADKTVVNSNPVLLDAAGYAPVFLDTGSYRIVVQDSTGAQIESPIDGVTGASGGFGPGNDPVAVANVIAVDTYQDVRNLVNQYDIVLVAGRLQVGDGGQGTFCRQTTFTADDDGITLCTASVSYLREFELAIDPLWYGLVYGGTANQTLNMLKAATASQRYSVPVNYAGTTYMNQNVTLPAGSSMTAGLGAIFTTGATAVSLIFADGSRFASQAIGVFGSKVQPIFGKSVCDAIHLSWMGGTTGDDKLAKLSICSTNNYNVVIDSVLSTSTTLSIPGNLNVADVGGLITVTGPMDLSFARVGYSGVAQWISYSSRAYITNVTMYPYARPEWFGAVGNLVADDTTPVYAAMKSGSVLLTGSYKVTASLSVSNLVLTGYRPAIFDGANVQSVGISMGANTLTGYSLTMTDAQLSGTATVYNSQGSPVSGIRSYIQNTVAGRFTWTDGWLDTKASIAAAGGYYVSNTVYKNTDTSAANYDSVKTKLRNTYTEDIVSAQFMGTDAAGKVVTGTTSPTFSTTSTTNLTVIGAYSLGYDTTTRDTLVSGNTASGTRTALFVNQGASAATITLPSGSMYYYEVMSTGTGPVTVNLPAGNTNVISGGATVVLQSAAGTGCVYGKLFRNGTAWSWSCTGA